MAPKCKVIRIASLFFLMILFIPIARNTLSAQTEQVLLTETDWCLPTYPVEEPDKNPIFFRNEAYQGTSRHYYPLSLNDQYTGERIHKEWKTLILENEYVELAITPEIGGKLYYATDKTNDYHFIYKNDAVKPSNIGMTGAWVSGGIEWCVLHHHRASTYLPIDYTTTKNEDGSKTIWVGEYEPRHGMRWTIGVTMFPGKSYFKVNGRIHNSSPFTHSFLYWANMATHTNENYQTIFPPSAQIATFHSKTDFTRWPVSTEIYSGADFTEGVDISWWKNVKSSNSFFVHDLKEDFMGGYDHGKNAGTVHIGNHHIVKGAKLWEWGSGERGQATEARLTENAGPYVELMTGAFSDNQPDYSWIRPYEVKRWEQYWYPVKGIEGFKNANLNGAVNLEERGEGNVFLGYYATQKIDNARIVLKHNDSIMHEKNIEISPDNPYAEVINVGTNFQLSELYTELVDLKTDEILVKYQPAELDPVDELPEPWEGYTSPEEIETVEELYLEGKRVEQFYAPRDNHMEWYNEALKRDPNDSRTNTAVGNHYLKNGDYKKAKAYFRKAIERLTRNYTRPSTGEALYLHGLTLKALGHYDEAIDTLYRAAWDYAYHSPAYYQLAQISMMRKEYDKALYQVNESLWTNARNNRAVALKASIKRKSGDFKGAITTLETIHEDDPLDFRNQNEYYLTARESGNQEKAEALISSLNKEMRDFDENYLELAVGYLNDGMLTEAENVLRRFKGENPLFDYYLGYISDKRGKPDQALEQFQAAAVQSVDYIFPHRLETVEVLKTALKHNPNDGKAYYYIGNILYEGQPEYAIDNWENAVKHNPTLAVAYRNLGWGYYYHYDDGEKAIPYYEKAIALNNKEAIYYAELDALYEMSNASIETRLNLFAGNNEVVKNRDDVFIRQIEVLNLAGYPDKAVEYLEGEEFAYREGSSRVRDIIIDTQLMLGKKYLEEQDYGNALHYFLEAQIPEEEAGSAGAGNRDIQVNYYIGLVYEALDNNSKAFDFFKRSSEQESGSITIMNYYQGLSYTKIGQADKAEDVFESMIADANRQLQTSDASEEAGVIFGARQAEDLRRSQLHTLRGLAYMGLNQISQANEDLNKAIELSNSNLWARAHLD